MASLTKLAFPTTTNLTPPRRMSFRPVAASASPSPGSLPSSPTFHTLLPKLFLSVEVLKTTYRLVTSREDLLHKSLRDERMRRHNGEPDSAAFIAEKLFLSSCLRQSYEDMASITSELKVL